MRNTENRTPRDLETRETRTRKKAWVVPDLLPNPLPAEGYTYRWIRIATRGNADATNVSTKLREGWEPVMASDHPEVHLGLPESERFKDNIVIGGLMLCRTPNEMVEARSEYYQAQSTAQIAAVDNDLLRQSDNRMPVFTERKSKVTFGKGR